MRERDRPETCTASGIWRLMVSNVFLHHITLRRDCPDVVESYCLMVIVIAGMKTCPLADKAPERDIID